MYNGVGLQTARGSGTNGCVETNKFIIRPRRTKVVVDSSKGFRDDQCSARKPSKDILEHDRKRKIELKLAVLEDKLMDQGYADAEIVDKLQEARAALEAADADSNAASSEDGSSVVGANKDVKI